MAETSRPRADYLLAASLAAGADAGGWIAAFSTLFSSSISFHPYKRPPRQTINGPRGESRAIEHLPAPHYLLLRAGGP